MRLFSRQIILRLTLVEVSSDPAIDDITDEGEEIGGDGDLPVIAGNTERDKHEDDTKIANNIRPVPENISGSDFLSFFIWSRDSHF